MLPVLCRMLIPTYQTNIQYEMNFARGCEFGSLYLYNSIHNKPFYDLSRISTVGIPRIYY